MSKSFTITFVIRFCIHINFCYLTGYDKDKKMEFYLRCTRNPVDAILDNEEIQNVIEH